jgi:hypothetical protein
MTSSIEITAAVRKQSREKEEMVGSVAIRRGG